MDHHRTSDVRPLRSLLPQSQRPCPEKCAHRFGQFPRTDGRLFAKFGWRAGASLIMFLYLHSASNSLLAQATHTVLVPYGSDYRYKVVGFGQMVGFEQRTFDDSAFVLGTAGFGSGAGCAIQSTTKTTWPTNTDILLRRTFTISGIAQNVGVEAAIDNDIQVFINGQDVSGGLQGHEGCASRGNSVFSVPPSLIVAGQNILAVRGRDRGGESYVDVQLSADVIPVNAVIPAHGGNTGSVTVTTYNPAIQNGVRILSKSITHSPLKPITNLR